MDPQPLPQTPQAPIQPTPALVKPFPFLPVLLVLLVLSLSSTSYLVYRNWKLQKQIADSVRPYKPLPSPTPTPDPTANWKTYTNETMGFSLRYPADIFPNVFSPNNEHVVLATSVVANRSGSAYDGIVISAPTSMIVGWDKQNVNIKDYVDRIISAPSDTDSQVRRVQTTIDGEKAEELFGVKHTDILTTVDIYFFHQGKLFQISLNPDDSSKYKILDQILSTFTFTDQTTPTPTTQTSTDYTCPSNGWVNCMPILNEEGKKACSPEAMAWYKKNCPNFQGGAL